MSAEADHEIVLKIGYHLAEVFSDEPSKILIWMVNSQEGLGGYTPCDMITMGKEDKLLEFIENLRSGNYHETSTW